MGRAAVLLVTVVLLAGCSSEVQQTHRPPIHPAKAALACPAKTPLPATGATLPSSPTGAVACLTDQPPNKRQPGIPVPRDVASVVARLVRAAPQASPTALKRCPRNGVGVHLVIRFGGADGSVTDLVERAPECGQGIAYLGATGYVVTRKLGEFLFALTSSTTDPSDIEDIVRAQRRYPACDGRRLTATYRAGGVGTGSDFGLVVLRDRSASWCELRGPVRVVGLDDRGRPVTPTVAATRRERVVLGPSSHGVPAGIGLAAAYRDDASAPNGLCLAHQVVPHLWRVEVAGRVLTVRNGRGGKNPQPGRDGLVTCRGAFTAQLRGDL